MLIMDEEFSHFFTMRTWWSSSAARISARASRFLVVYSGSVVGCVPSTTESTAYCIEGRNEVECTTHLERLSFEHVDKMFKFHGSRSSMNVIG